MAIKKNSNKTLIVEIFRDGKHIDLNDNDWDKKFIWRKKGSNINQPEIPVTQASVGKFEIEFTSDLTNIQTGEYIGEIEATNKIDPSKVIVVPDDENDKYIQFKIIKSLR